MASPVARAAHPADDDVRKAHIRAAIRTIPDFPKPGIMFQDITTLLLNPVAYKDCCSLLEERYRSYGLDVIAGFEARGFFFGPPLALALGLPFVPLRKPKKLPGPTISEAYALEYGTDALEMHVGAVAPGQRVLLVDDLVATGGTLAAGAALVRRAGGVPVEACCIIELPELGGRKRLGDLPCYTLIEARDICKRASAPRLTRHGSAG